MFLEEKLETVWQQNIERKANFNVSIDVSIEMLNTCIAHIEEHIKPKDTWLNTFRIIKQTDIIWRTFAKKKGFGENFFRANYIVRRLSNYSAAREYFSITTQEVEKYAKVKS